MAYLFLDEFSASVYARSELYKTIAATKAILLNVLQAPLRVLLPSRDLVRKLNSD